MLCGFTEMLTDKYIESARMRVIRMLETALTSSWYHSNDKWFKIDIVRNQLCFGPHHSQNAMLNLQKIHDVAFRSTQSILSAS